jgi:hypothetical protein
MVLTLMMTENPALLSCTNLRRILGVLMLSPLPLLLWLPPPGAIIS